MGEMIDHALFYPPHLLFLNGILGPGTGENSSSADLYRGIAAFVEFLANIVEPSNQWN
jgi:hypothetical protein